MDAKKAALIFGGIAGGGSGDAQPKMIFGTGEPTSSTAGKVTQQYRDENTGLEYVCTSADDMAGTYTWERAYTPRVVGETLYL